MLLRSKQHRLPHEQLQMPSHLRTPQQLQQPSQQPPTPLSHSPQQMSQHPPQLRTPPSPSHQHSPPQHQPQQQQPCENLPPKLQPSPLLDCDFVDARTVASGGLDGAVRLSPLDGAGGERVLGEHAGAARCVRRCDAVNALVTAGWDATLTPPRVSKERSLSHTRRSARVAKPRCACACVRVCVCVCVCGGGHPRRWAATRAAFALAASAAAAVHVSARERGV